QATRRMQNFYINGRFVKTTTAMAALEEAYKHSIMVGKFPGCVLDIKMPLYDVDVNVHPSKIEVRFANEKPVFSAVYSAVKNALEKIDLSKSDGINAKQRLTLDQVYKKNEDTPCQIAISENENKNDTVTIQTIPKMRGYFSGRVANSFEKSINSKEQGEKDFFEIPVHNIKNTLLSAFVEDKKPAETFRSKSIDIVADDIKIPQQHNEKNTTINSQKINSTQEQTNDTVVPKTIQKKAKETEDKQQNNKISRFQGYKFVGELFETYIIMQSETNFIMVDKHAAHERLIFNRLRGEFQKGMISKQMLLAPETIRLSKTQYQTAIDNIEKICSFGFEIEDFGEETIIVREIPLFLTHDNSKSVIIDIIENIISYKNDLMPEEIDNLLHSISCKSAIKANDKNQTEELLKLIDELDENADVNFCPHGRPIMKTFSKRDIEKQFGRV
ncbi:MAG: DNA mismatch repair endonuclease MutL, partial [Oscillospiraceae bacterium]